MDLNLFKISETNLENPKLRLGSGQFGRVFESTYKGKQVVYKIMKHAIDPFFFYTEIKILNMLHHKSIPKLIGYVDTPSKLIIIMEKAHGITLNHLILVL
jgi:serine/threonine protein kinase